MSDTGLERFALWRTITDLGWFSFLLMGLGGLSLLDIIERVITIDLNLIAVFEFALNGYRRLASVLGLIVEPPLEFALRHLSELLQIQFHVREYWRSIFVLAMIPWIANARIIWRDEGADQAMNYLFFAAAGMLVLSLFVSLGGVEVFSFGIAFPQATVAAVAVAILLVGVAGVVTGIAERKQEVLRRGLATVGGFLAATLIVVTNAIVTSAS